MDKKNACLLLFVCVVPFIGYFLNPFLAYYDSYAFLSGACGLFEGNSYLLPLAFCNHFLNKLILLGLYVVSIFCVAFFGEKVYDKQLGWRVGLYSATLTPLFFQEAMKFENDIFGWTLVFVGFSLFGLAYASTKRQHKLLWGIIAWCACIFAILFWQASFLGALIIGLMWLPLLVLSMPTIFLSFWDLINHALLNRGIGEEQFGAGIVPVMIMFFPLLSKPRNTKFFLATWFAFAVGFIKIRFMLFAIPLLALNFLHFEQRMGKKWKRWPNMKVVCCGLAMAFFFIGFFSTPNIYDMNQMESAIALAEDNNILLYNDWEVGWQITYLGYDTNYRASFPDPDYNNTNNKVRKP